MGDPFYFHETPDNTRELAETFLICTYTIMYTMCSPSCYHNGFMATPELGHRMYNYTLLDCIVESQECSNCIYIFV